MHDSFSLAAARCSAVEAVAKVSAHPVQSNVAKEKCMPVVVARFSVRDLSSTDFYHQSFFIGDRLGQKLDFHQIKRKIEIKTKAIMQVIYCASSNWRWSLQHAKGLKLKYRLLRMTMPISSA